MNFFGYGASENAIPLTPSCAGSSSAHYNTPGVNGIGDGGFPVDMFQDPVAAWNNVRQPILGYDTRIGGWGVCRGLPYWNMDLSVKKMFKITERISTEFRFVVTNMFNHNQWGDVNGDYLDTSNKSIWGVLPGSVTNGTNTYMRQMQFGLRLNF